ncbi:HXXEE domain-containing protein [Streptomyces sp. ODS28]|uniref:HXXEE domain-containing protein n=1 Tax=Streptomyces sp. ODS28 TaxID=3136688 RepID=UPI0031E84679
MSAQDGTTARETSYEVPYKTSYAVPAAATWGLLLAFAVHDAEELATMPAWAARRADRLEERYPRLPSGVVDALRIDTAHAATAIGLMGGVVAAASAAGAWSGGRSAFYQSVLAGFGLHSLTHLGQSAAARGYTPGVVTAPLVVAPFGCWAWARLRRAGVLRETTGRDVGRAALMFPAVAAGVHAGAFALRAAARRKARRRSG